MSGRRRMHHLHKLHVQALCSNSGLEIGRAGTGQAARTERCDGWKLSAKNDIPTQGLPKLCMLQWEQMWVSRLRWNGMERSADPTTFRGPAEA